MSGRKEGDVPMTVSSRYARSFDDALSLARNSRDQATIYYRKDGIRAVYDVVAERNVTYANTGAMFINGRCVTVRDLPPKMQQELSGSPDDIVYARKYAKVAKEIFEHNGISVDTGWDLMP